MGYHYFHPGLMADLPVDPLEPEALVYAPGENGKLKLAAVEWVVRGPNSNPPGLPAPDPDRARNGDAHSGPTPRAGLLPHACLGLEAQPGRDVRGLESQGQLPLAATSLQ